ncbi:hypothetical protein BGW38_008410 [Lunasporangiospora selenospora]|uniref:Uncharacterized protein n=1 Tax=Lunasporangiospora selenospora TaxID=979761 RepID=A0A9P6FZZ1_9FUNG|nr:hypothetical protein BGW38_008410 [Lunasporangiospora selenospora]
MLHPLASRWVQPARTFLRASHAFPRNPIFLSFTPRHLSVSSRSLKDTTPSNSPDQNPTVASTDSSSPESPPQTNLEHSLAAVSCTVSPPATFAFLKPTPVVLLTGPFGGNWQVLVLQDG